jgi:ATP-binding cassette, subfamily B, multidrug efflux pump
LRAQELVRDYVKSNRKQYCIAIVSIIVSNVIQVYFPRVLGAFTDDLEKGVLVPGTITRYSLLLLAIGVSYVCLFGLGQYTVMRLGRKFEFDARQKLFQHFTTLSERYYSKRGTGALLSHVINDITSVRESISMGITQTTNSTFLIVLTLIMMMTSKLPSYFIIISVLPIAFIPFVVMKFGPKVRARSMNVQESLSKMTESAEEQIGGMRVTKTFAVEEVARGRFAARVDQIRENQLKLVRISSLFQAILPFLGALSFVITIAYGGYGVIHHQISLGTFVEFTLYLRMMIGPLQMVGNVINMTHRSRASADRLNALLAEIPDIQDSPGAITLPNSPLGIEIKNLSFTYPMSKKPALEDIHISLPAGHTLGIVGKTGSGKTTLAKLLLRIYNPPAHTVWIDDVDILDTTIESLRSNIAYVPQDGFLFSTTIRDNIAFSNRDASLEQVEVAAKQAQMHTTIMGFPDQYETKLGERGVTLSGGQRQRTSLARGFLKQAPILILDDSVSAVDAVTEKQIIEQIKSIRKGQTTIIIAHRLSAVEHADEIIVLDNGKIIERGTHQTLIALGGAYASLHRIQQEGVPHAQRSESII